MSYTLSTSVNYTTPEGYVDCVAVGDVSGDGRADVVGVAGPHATDDAWDVVVWAQQEDGSLGAAETHRYTWISPVDNDCGVVLSDLNEDGTEDVAIAAPDSLTRLISDGAGGLDGPYANADLAALSIAAADLDDDGHLDLLTSSHENALTWWRGDGRGDVEDAVISGADAWDGREDLALGDVTGDGLLDAVIIAYEGPLLQVFAGEGDGRFDPDATSYDPEIDWENAEAVAVGDLTADGRSDVLVVGDWPYDSAVALYPQSADGSLGGPRWILTEPNAASIQVTDVDGDGALDIALTHPGWDEVSVTFIDGADTEVVTAETHYEAGWWTHTLAVADVSGDGCADLVTAAGEHGIEVNYGSGCAGGDASDMDSDGIPDLVDDCPDVADTDQANLDSDAMGDACDPCPSWSDDGSDRDADGVGDACDSCVATPDLRSDADGDGVDDACDPVAEAVALAPGAGDRRALRASSSIGCSSGGAAVAGWLLAVFAALIVGRRARD